MVGLLNIYFVSITNIDEKEIYKYIIKQYCDKDYPINSTVMFSLESLVNYQSEQEGGVLDVVKQYLKGIYVVGGDIKSDFEVYLK